MRDRPQTNTPKSGLIFVRDIFACFLIASIVYGLLFFLSNFVDFKAASTIAIFTLIGMPVIVGALCQMLIDRRIHMTLSAMLGRVFVASALLCLPLVFTNAETLVCLAMAAPIFIVLYGFGIWLMRICLRFSPDANRLNASTLILIPFVGLSYGIAQTATDQTYTVTDQIEINAEPSKVWAHLVDFKQVQPEERLATFSHNILGAIQPDHSVLHGTVRTAYWTGGVTYEERMTSLIPNKAMDWDIVFPKDYHMPGLDKHISPNSDQLSLLSGRYTLDWDGTKTIVTLQTDYRLRTPLNAYISMWGHQFLHDNHRSILHVVAQRAGQ